MHYQENLFFAYISLEAALQVWFYHRSVMAVHRIIDSLIFCFMKIKSHLTSISL